jgi:hypothetical protein
MNYIGSVGRIERKNQATGQFQNLGPVSQKEEEAYMNGTHKKLAFKQAFIGALVWTLILYGIMYSFPNKSGSTFLFDKSYWEKCSIKSISSRSDNLFLLLHWASPNMPYKNS